MGREWGEERGQVIAVVRTVNPTRLALAPHRRVAIVDGALQATLKEIPQVLWEAYEMISFALTEVRVVWPCLRRRRPVRRG